MPSSVRTGVSHREAFKAEADLAKVVIAWLSSLGWEIYQEVQPGGMGSSIVDIVGKKGTTLCVVECKLSVSLRVLNQARHWRPDANLVYVAVPSYSRNRDLGLAYDICRMLGIGVLVVTPNQYPGIRNVEERVHPELRRNRDSFLMRALNDGQKTFAEAGNPDGRRWTPFQETCQNVRSYVQAHPGAPMKEVIDNVKHHYSTPMSARQSLAKWIEGGSVPGLRIERIGRQARVWPITGHERNA